MPKSSSINLVKQVELYRLHGENLLQNNKWEEACRSFSSALRLMLSASDEELSGLTEEHKTYLLASCYHYMGMARGKSGHSKSAITIMQTALSYFMKLAPLSKQKYSRMTAICNEQLGLYCERQSANYVRAKEEFGSMFSYFNAEIKEYGDLAKRYYLAAAKAFDEMSVNDLTSEDESVRRRINRKLNIKTPAQNADIILTAKETANDRAALSTLANITRQLTYHRRPITPQMNAVAQLAEQGIHISWMNSMEYYRNECVTQLETHAQNVRVGMGKENRNASSSSSTSSVKRELPNPMIWGQSKEESPKSEPVEMNGKRQRLS